MMETCSQGPEPSPNPVWLAATIGAQGKQQQLDTLHDASARFSVGDYRETRIRLRRLLATNPGPELREPAQQMLGRIGVDPVAVYLGLGSLILLIVVVYVTLAS